MALVVRRPVKKIAKRQLELRERLWPRLDTKWLWHRKERDGFITMPRSMPLILSVMDDLSQGQPVSSTYLDLWCRTFDECFVTLSKSKEMAFHAGFTGQRAERTWRGRMKILADLGFIDIQPGPSGEMSYALVKNPYLVIKRLKEAGETGVRKDKYNALVQRCLEIGETSLDEPVPEMLLVPEPPMVTSGGEMPF
jgi:hypothetical protein